MQRTNPISYLNALWQPRSRTQSSRALNWPLLPNCSVPHQNPVVISKRKFASLVFKERHHGKLDLNYIQKQKLNKKVLLRECMRHTARHVASTCCAALVGGYNCHLDPGRSTPCPDLERRYPSPAQTWEGGTPTQTWKGVPPAQTWEGGTPLARMWEWGTSPPAQTWEGVPPEMVDKVKTLPSVILRMLAVKMIQFHFSFHLWSDSQLGVEGQCKSIRTQMRSGEAVLTRVSGQDCVLSRSRTADRQARAMLNILTRKDSKI